MIEKNNELNGGFPPLILKNKNINSNTKERYFATTVINNLNIRQILQSKNDKNILDKNNEKKDNQLEIITSL
jgi:hypothetical protein